MKFENVVKRLEGAGYWVRNEVNCWYKATKRGCSDITFGVSKDGKVEGFQIGLARYASSLKKAIEISER